MAVIQINNLVVKRQGNPICRIADLQVATAEHVGVDGDNGSGKTTLLRVIAGLERRHEGSCAVEPVLRDRVFVAQNPVLFRGTVLMNVMYGLRARGYTRRASRKTAMQWLDAFGITSLGAAVSSHLSGGERRRTALAQALAFHPKLVLLDEPLSDLDEDGRHRLARVLAELHDTTVVLTSPSPLPEGFVTRCIKLS